MTLAVALTTDIAKNAGVAYVHYLSFMVCFGALVLERRLIKANPDRGEATAMVITDIVYGIAALALLVSGILRVIHFGRDQPSTRRTLVLVEGRHLSLRRRSVAVSNHHYILWAIPLRKGELPKVSEALAGRLSWIINIELIGFASIPMLATLMARGVGLPAA